MRERIRPVPAAPRIMLALIVMISWIASATTASASGPTWRLAASMHMARDEFAIAQANNRIYAIGGMTGPLGTALDANEMYDPSVDDWQKFPPLPVARRAVRAAAVGHVVYVFGGSTEDNRTLARTDAFDTDTRTWSVKTPLPSPVQSPDVVAVGTAIYVIGGLSDSARLVDTVSLFDTNTNAWETLPPLITPRSNMGTAVLGGTIYAIGGAGPDGPLFTVERYDIAKHTWNIGKPLPEPMMNLGAAAIDGQIHVLLHRTHYIYSPETDTWASAAPMETPRHGFGTAVIGDNLYVIGGCHLELFDTAVMEVLDVRPRASHLAMSNMILGIVGTVTMVSIAIFLIAPRRPTRRAT